VKHILALALATLFCVSMTESVHAQCTPSAPPPTITTICQLQNIGLNSTSLAGHYALSGNVDAAGFNFNSLGVFTGTLDGNGYTINNLAISNTSLFTTIDPTGVVKNLGLSNVHAFSDAFHIGA
jgi:hypothetical protein